MNGYNFTDRVRKVLQMAREEAARLHHEYVGTEHILLGLIREGEGVAAAVLTNLNVDLEEIQQKIEETVKKGKAAAAAGPDLPYTSRAKKVLELAMSEARELNHSYVGTEHLLLGLLREEKGIAAQVLTDAGVNLEQARAETLRLLGSEMPSGPTPAGTSAQPASPKSEKKSKTPALDHFCRELSQVAAEVIERRGFRLLLTLGARGLRAGAGRRRPRRHLAAEQPQRFGARLLQVDARVGQDLRRDPLLLPQQTEQQMLGADIGVVQLARLAHRELEHFLGPGGVRQVGPGGGGRFALLHRLLDLLLDLFEVDVEIRQYGRGDAFAFADQPQQNVLGPHVLVVQPRSFLPRHLEDLAHPIREVVPVHRSPTSDCFGLEHAAHRRCAHRRQLRIAAVTTFERRKVRGLGEYQQLVECVYTPARDQIQPHPQPHPAQQIH